MAGGREYSRTQKKIIDRYYDHHGTILAQRLGEIVTDMAFAQGEEKKLDRLWTRAEQALSKAKGAGLKVSEAEVRQVLASRSPEKLASLVNRLG
ncbi:MAG: hypothetical protein ACF8Q5_11970 [Phycisphaerales bacterium JB040]